jgi:hypothetical protein
MDIHIEDDSVVRLKEGSHIEVDDGSAIEVRGTQAHPFFLQSVQNIAPVAVHLKELNHIDPISVESLVVSEVRNIEPLNIEKLNVTNLPQINMALRQLPPVELNIRDLPAVSIGLHQILEMPSNYQLRAQFLGFELFRINLSGRTRITPTERFRQEQQRADNRSFPKVATAGNPAIPSVQSVKNVTYTATPQCGHHEARQSHCAGLRVGQGEYHGAPHSGLRVCSGGGR